MRADTLGSTSERVTMARRAGRRLFMSNTRSARLVAELRSGFSDLSDAADRNLGSIVDSVADAFGALATHAEQRGIRPTTRNHTWLAPANTVGFFPAPTPAPILRPKENDRVRPTHAVVAGNLATPALHTGFAHQENDLAARAHLFDEIVPYAGTPPRGFHVDWLGVLHDGRFRSYLGIEREMFGGMPVATERPTLSDGEGWFEAVNQVEAAQDARGRYVMVTLGACYGAQAVGSAVALRKINPVPFKLVAVEPEPVNYEWTARHFHDNGINPEDHWLIKAAISDSNNPVFFPVGAPGTGAQNAFSTNEENAREHYVRALIESGRQDEALRNLLLRNTTGLKKSLLPGEGFDAEITLLSAITLADVLGPFQRVDYLEADIQQSEIIVFPPFMNILKRKVRRVHIGTHGKDVHASLSRVFRRNGWQIVFDFEPNSSHVHPLGAFDLNDGVLTVLNPDLP